MVFAGQEVPSGYASEAIHGFVEELVVNDDPEYQVSRSRMRRSKGLALVTAPLFCSGLIRFGRLEHQTKQDNGCS